MRALVTVLKLSERTYKSRAMTSRHQRARRCTVPISTLRTTARHVPTLTSAEKRSASTREVNKQAKLTDMTQALPLTDGAIVKYSSEAEPLHD
eukprot:6290-Heterococcus_DN1.PRE.4